MVWKKLKDGVVYLLGVVCLLPFLIMLLKSLEGAGGHWSMGQYAKALFATEDFFTGFWNSVIYTALILLFHIPASLLAGYGFSRYFFRGRDSLFWVYIVLMLMPFQATLVPQYITLKALGIVGTWWAVVLPNIFATFGVFLIAQGMRGLDKEIFEAGRLDGLHEGQLLFKMALPLCKSILWALTLLLFIQYWSMVEQPLIFLTDSQDMPLSMTLSATGRLSGIAFAGGVLFSVLPLMLYAFSYEDLMQGISLSAALGKEQGGRLVNAGFGERTKGKIARGILIFLAGMMVCTLITQKVAYVLTPQVQITAAHSGTLQASEKASEKGSEKAAQERYETIVPSSCVVQQGQEHYVYVLGPERSRRKRWIASRISVHILKTNGMQTAISGGVHSQMRIVRYSTGVLQDGAYVRPVWEESSNE